VIATVPLWLVTSRLEPWTESAGPEDAAPRAGRELIEAGADARRRRPDIQGLRALAVLVVVAYHAGLPIRGGFVGVDVFFVISGYVITALLVRQAGSERRVRLGLFYGRRVRRLAPAMCLMTLTTLVMVAFLYSPVGPDQGEAAKAAVAATFLSANAYFFATTGGYFQPDANSNPFLHTWSLSVEEQFYLVFPAFLALLLTFGRRLDAHRARRLVLRGFIVVALASLLLCVALVENWVHVEHFTTRFTDPQAELRKFAFFGTPPRGWEFLAGGILVFLRPVRRRAKALRVVGLALVVGSVLALRDGADVPGYLVAVPVLGTALLLAASADHPDRVHATLSSRPVTWLGDRSYSWYLWHWPFILFAAYLWPDVSWVRTAAAVVALAVAAAAYRYVEYPIHRGQWPSSRHALTAVLVAGIAASTVVGIGVWQLSQHGWGSARIQAIRADVAPEHLDIANGCATTAPLGSPGHPPCTWTVPHSRGTVLLIGDSNAGHLSEPFIAAARSLGYDATIATSGGCPMAVTPRPLTAVCTEFVRGSIEELQAHPGRYAAVVVSNATVGYLGGPESNLFGGSTAQVVTAWNASIDRTVRQLRRVAPVLVIGSVPQYRDLPSCLAPTTWRPRASSCGELSAGSPALDFRQRVIDNERRTVLEDGGEYLDTASLLCRDTGCSALVNGISVYRDGAHLSVSGSMLFERPLRQAIDELVGNG
jgi:peptidoglycan/LPS O-acetylase OafA/YrhL